MGAPIGLVLAGGLGRRMGRSKGELELDGRPLAERAASVLQPLCTGLLVSIRAGAANPAPACAAVEDPPPPGRGPLAGIEAAFAATARFDLLVLACDYLHLESRLLRGLLERAEDEAEVVVPVDGGGRVHPLVGLWRRSTESRLREALADGRYKVGDFLAECRVARLGPEEFPEIDLDGQLVNANRPGDLPRGRT